MRQQKEQYAALARQINQYPPREETQAEIHALSTELVSPACPSRREPPRPALGPPNLRLAAPPRQTGGLDSLRVCVRCLGPSAAGPATQGHSGPASQGQSGPANRASLSFPAE